MLKSSKCLVIWGGYSGSVFRDWGSHAKKDSPAPRKPLGLEARGGELGGGQTLRCSSSARHPRGSQRPLGSPPPLGAAGPKGCAGGVGRYSFYYALPSHRYHFCISRSRPGFRYFRVGFLCRRQYRWRLWLGPRATPALYEGRARPKPPTPSPTPRFALRPPPRAEYPSVPLPPPRAPAPCTPAPAPSLRPMHPAPRSAPHPHLRSRTP